MWKAGLPGLRPGSLCCLGDNLFLSFSLLLHRSLPPPNCPRPPAPQRRSPSRKGVVSKAHRQWFLDTPSATPPLSQGMMRLRFAEASGSLSWAEPRRALPLGLFSPRSRAERTGGSHATTDTMDGWMRAQTEGPPPHSRSGAVATAEALGSPSLSLAGGAAVGVCLGWSLCARVVSQWLCSLGLVGGGVVHGSGPPPALPPSLIRT